MDIKEMKPLRSRTSDPIGVYGLDFNITMYMQNYLRDELMRQITRTTYIEYSEALIRDILVPLSGFVIKETLKRGMRK